MKKWVCKVCGYVHEGDEPPEICPVCKVGREFFELVETARSFPDGHVPGQARGTDPRVVGMLKERLQNDSREVALYLAMARAAEREGYPEAAGAFRSIAEEEAEHAGRLMEMLGEGFSASTEENLGLRADAEARECADKKELAQLATSLGYDAIHDALHEMSRDESRHGAALHGLKERLFPAGKGARG